MFTDVTEKKNLNTCDLDMTGEAKYTCHLLLFLTSTRVCVRLAEFL